MAKCKMNTLRFHWLLAVGYFAMYIEIGGIRAFGREKA
jgi:hypothetical protein